MTQIIVHDYDNFNVRVECETDIAFELAAHFSFYVKDAHFSPLYKSGQWDGRIKLFNSYTKLIMAGLADRIEMFAESRGYSYSRELAGDTIPQYSDEAIDTFIKSLDLPFEPYEHQVMGLRIAINEWRRLLLSPTASGKSLILYMITRWFTQDEDCRVLIIVPNKLLVEQMYGDFQDYGWDVETNMHRIKGGKSKTADKRCFVSTWQSIYKQPKSYFEQFDVVIGDEAHLFTAKSLTSVMSKLSCPVRIGCTGTVEDSKINTLTLEGLFGKIEKLISTKELMDKEQVAKLKIKGLVLKYTDEERRIVCRTDYKKEIDYIIQHDRRMNFLGNLVKSLKGNTLVLFRYVTKHGKPIFEHINSIVDEERVHLIHGGVDDELRNEIRGIVETSTNAIVLASLGTFSTGANVKNLNNVIFATPNKSKISVIQSVGRSLRRSATKDSAVLYDICDDLSWKSKKNFALTHFLRRMELYNEEEFDYDLHNINL